jgi:hypothetical protein
MVIPIKVELGEPLRITKTAEIGRVTRIYPDGKMILLVEQEYLKDDVDDGVRFVRISDIECP